MRVRASAWVAVLAGAWLIFCVPTASAIMTHTAAWSTLSSQQQTLSDLFRQSNKNTQGDGCGNNPPASNQTFSQDQATAGYQLQSGHPYFFTVGARNFPSAIGSLAPWPLVDVVGSVSGRLFTVNIYNGPATPTTSNVKLGTAAVVTSFDDNYNDSNRSTASATVFFKGLATETLTVYCASNSGTQGAVTIYWNPVAQANSTVVATFLRSDYPPSTNSCPVPAFDNIRCSMMLVDANTSDSNPPGAPVLTGNVVGAGSPILNVLSWTTPSGSGILGYNISRFDAYTGKSTTINAGLVNAYQEASSTSNVSYVVAAFSILGNGPLSNNVTLRIPPSTLFDTAQFSGNSVAMLGSSSQAAKNATLAIFALIFVLFVMAAVIGATGSLPAAIGGGVVAFVLMAAFGFFQWWIVVFVVVGGGALGLLFMKRAGGAGA